MQFLPGLYEEEDYERIPEKRDESKAGQGTG